MALVQRKSMPRWTKQVRVNPGMGLEGPLDDGFSWRNYMGRKQFLGAKLSKVEAIIDALIAMSKVVLATKQVQRSDEDSNHF
ncbi:hypothetical protein NC652_028772 [Populus alba x Populus x berolinensis]|nr:hypothetical protein NC652_028772 [Populus alba x Populus x berolinensis]